LIFLSIREVVRNAFGVEDYHPSERKDWDEAYEKLLDIQEFR
jgi:hypothetical protein